MDFYSVLSCNVMSSLVLLVLGISVCRVDNRNVATKRLIAYTVFVLIAFLLSEVFYRLFLGRTDDLSRFAALIYKNLYFIFNTAIVFIYAAYIHNVLYGANFTKKPFLVISFSAFCLNGLLAVANFFVPVLFKINAAGQFEVSLVGMTIYTAINYVILIANAILAMINYTKVSKRTLFAMLMYPLPPIIAEVIYLLNKNLDWRCLYCLSALLVYISYQRDALYQDELTGLANRYALHDTVNKWFSGNKSNLKIYGIMLDIDDLKKINDKYGHVAGDNAILSVAKILLEIKYKNVYTIRYGGDEFLLLWRSRNDEQLQKITEYLNQSPIAQEENDEQTQNMKFSFCSFCCTPDEIGSATEFLKIMDKNMYANKRRKEMQSLQTQTD